MPAIDDEVRANAEEIAAVRFVSADTLDRELAENPERFTPWFKMEWEALKTNHSAVLETYSSARAAP